MHIAQNLLLWVLNDILLATAAGDPVLLYLYGAFDTVDLYTGI